MVVSSTETPAVVVAPEEEGASSSSILVEVPSSSSPSSPPCEEERHPSDKRDISDSTLSMSSDDDYDESTSSPSPPVETSSSLNHPKIQMTTAATTTMTTPLAVSKLSDSLLQEGADSSSDNSDDKNSSPQAVTPEPRKALFRPEGGEEEEETNSSTMKNHHQNSSSSDDREAKQPQEEEEEETVTMMVIPITPASTDRSTPASAPSKLEPSSYDYPSSGSGTDSSNELEEEENKSKGRSLVTSNSSGSKKKSNPRPNRGRIVSLDRGKTEVSKQLQQEQEQQRRKKDASTSSSTASGGLVYPATDDEQRRKRANTHHATSSSSRRSSRYKYDSPDSSDDESSYFASNLPSPKSSSRGSFYSSTGGGGSGSVMSSNNARASFYSAGKQESDRSLSFSDESDDERNHHQQQVRISPMIPPKPSISVGDNPNNNMQMFPQQSITRMHSVSSLVSSTSSKSHRRSVTGDSLTTTGASDAEASLTDPSVQAELANMMMTQQQQNHPYPSQLQPRVGSPVMGHAGMYYGTPSPLYPPPSASSTPPLLVDGAVASSSANNASGLLHPDPNYVNNNYDYPQPMTLEQAQANEWFQGVSGGEYGSMNHTSSNLPNAAVAPLPPLGLRTTSSTTVSTSTLPFVYSEDDESGELSFQRMAAEGAAPASGKQVPAGGSSSGGPVQRKSGNSSSQQQGGGSSQNSSARQAPRSSGPSGSGGMSSGGAGGSSGNLVSSRSAVSASDSPGGDNDKPAVYQKKTFKVYWQRWIMLMYMSILNLLSDWTCYSVAPIAALTKDAFGDIDPEQLVVIFLGANAIASACEPMMLARLGLRRTVVVGALLLMIGSIIKSGGVPPLFQFEMIMGQEEWRIYLGFFLVGLSQPLYQCTPALLSASWFPEKERTMATGVALNANQLGIGFAFIFGTILVGDSNDIFGYFGLLSLVSTVAFLGTLIQFDDAPPTPPSDTARVMKGTMQVNLPTMGNIVQSFRGHVRTLSGIMDTQEQTGLQPGVGAPSPADGTSKTAPKAAPPSPALDGPTRNAREEIQSLQAEADRAGVLVPSPMMPGRVGGEAADDEGEDASDPATNQQEQGYNTGGEMPYSPYMGYPATPQGGAAPGGIPPTYGQFAHPQYQYPYYDPRYQQQQAFYQQQYYPYQQAGAVPGQTMAPPQPYYYPMTYPPQPHPFDLPPENLDDGAEPILTFTDHHLDIDIRDDQVIRSLRACLSRQGFIHALVAFTVSGIVINTLSTFMDYLVRLNGAPRAYTGIVGGTFQFVIMISSLIIGKQTDKTRAYYSVTIAMLVLGAFGLAECGVSLDANRGTDLRWTLVIVAALVGPLQPVSTELGVDVVYPLSENTVLVIQQLFSNLLSALFIPFFKALKDIGTTAMSDTEMYERPQYTFSFYLLIVIHAAATVFFATFNGRYLRYEHELQKKAEEERLQRESDKAQGSHAFHPFYKDSNGGEPSNERQPLIGHQV